MKKNLLFVSPVSFTALHQRHQAFATELNKAGFNLCYLNPFQTGLPRLTVDYKKDSFASLTTRVPFKAANYPWFQRISNIFAYLILKKKLNFNDSETILWIADPSQADLASFKWKQIIYDRCDWHGHFPGQKIRSWQYYESCLYKKSDYILISHAYLKEDIPSKYLKKAILVGNAATNDFIKVRHVDIGEKIELISSGAHFEWTDFDWLSKLALQKNVRLNIVGLGRGKKFKKLINTGQTVFHRQLSKQKLAELMKKCHIGLVPFVDINLIKAVDPIKVYEYHASGLEIWAPPIESLRSNRFINYYFSESHEFETRINKIRKQGLCTNNESVITWKDRMKKVLGILNNECDNL